MKKNTNRTLFFFTVALASQAFAENILVVGDGTLTGANADMTSLLTGAGHTVTAANQTNVSGLLSTTYLSGPQTKAQFLSGYDLIIIPRNVTSANFTDAAGWAALTNGVMSLGSYATRSSDRLRWQSGSTGDAVGASLGLNDTDVSNASHPIWNGVTITSGQADLYNNPNPGGNIHGATGTFGGGTLLGDIAFNGNGNLIAWEIGTLLGGYIDAPVQGRRVIFTLVGDAANEVMNTGSLTTDGDLVFLNAVAWAAVPVPSSAPVITSFVATPPDKIEIIFTSVPGNQYQIWNGTMLNDFLPLDTVVAEGSSVTYTRTGVNLLNREFFRVNDLGVAPPAN